MSQDDSSLAPATAEDFVRRARARLSFDLPANLFVQGVPFGGDHDLDGSAATAMRLRPAAVLIAVVPRDIGASVVLTERPHSMRDHSGQIAFPGGKIEAFDASPKAAALREAEEEIGLRPEDVTPLGYLDPYVTGTGFMVVPTVAVVTRPLRLRPDPREVAAAFEVPLDFLMDPGNHQRHSRDIGGRLRQFYAMPFQDRFIWGATAGMLRNLHQRLYA